MNRFTLILLFTFKSCIFLPMPKGQFLWQVTRDKLQFIRISYPAKNKGDRSLVPFVLITKADQHQKRNICCPFVSINFWRCEHTEHVCFLFFFMLILKDMKSKNKNVALRRYMYNLSRVTTTLLKDDVNPSWGLEGSWKFRWHTRSAIDCVSENGIVLWHNFPKVGA